MTTSKPASTLIYYPEADGEPMSESDATRDYLIYSVVALRKYFQSRPNIYVSGNLFIYYQEGDPTKVMSPDTFVVFGVPRHKRRSYKTWKEGNKLPSFILEVTSFTTQKKDEEEKPILYASLGVQEYFQYDPTADYLRPQLKGSTLVNGQYQPLPIQYQADGTPFIYSQVLGLELRLEPPYKYPIVVIPGAVSLPLELRYFDPQTGTTLMTPEELDQALEQAERDRLEAEQALEQSERDRLEAEQALEQSERDRLETEQALEQERLVTQQNQLRSIQRLQAMGLALEQIAEALSLTVEEVRSALEMPSIDL